MLPVAIYNQNVVITPYLMNNDGVAGTEPTTDDTLARTLTLTSTPAPEFVAIVESASFGIGSFGEVTGSSGGQCSSTTEFTTDLNPQGQDWCIEFMRIQRRNARPDMTQTDFTLQTNSGGGDHQRIIVSTRGAADSGGPTLPSSNHVYIIETTSFSPTENVTLDSEVILGASGRYPNNTWVHHAIIRKESDDSLQFYVDGIRQFVNAGNGAGKLNGDQDSFQFIENFAPAHASPLHDSTRIVIRNNVYGTGATIVKPTSSVGIF